MSIFLGLLLLAAGINDMVLRYHERKNARLIAAFQDLDKSRGTRD